MSHAVSKSGLTLLIALALAAACGGDDGGGPTGPPPPPPPSTTAAVTTAGSPPPRFIPTSVALVAGGKVTWTNGSPVDHNLIATTSNWQMNEDLPVGGSFEITIAQPGNYSYHCSLHEGMTGTIVVK